MSFLEEIPLKSPTMEVDEQTKPQIKVPVTTQVNANSPTKPPSPKPFTTLIKNNGPSPTKRITSSPITVKGSPAVDESKNNANVAYFSSFPPGYRFTPSEEELVVHYLKKKVSDQPLPQNRIVDVNLYSYDPENLTEKYKEYGENEWYFFTPRERKYKNGSRPKRGTNEGYWKATGADKAVKSNGITVGLRKALVFYKGKPPKGDKTNWIMHEYRVNEPRPSRSANDMTLDDWVLCNIHKKADKSIKPRHRDDDHSTDQDETNDHMGMDCDYNQMVDSTGYANTYGDYMHQPLQTGFPQIPQFSNVPFENIANVNHQLQGLSVNHGTCTKIVEPICFRPPLMHSQEGIFRSRYLNENSFSGSKSSGLQDENVWSNQYLESIGFGMPLDYYTSTCVEPLMNIENIFPTNAPNNPPSDSPTVTSTNSN